MQLFSRISHFFERDVWAYDLSTLPWWKAFGIRACRFIVVAVSDFREDALSMRATSLVSTTLLSLVPFLAVTVSVLKAFGVHQHIEPFLAQALDPLGPKGTEITNRIIQFVNNLRVGALGAVGLLGLFYTTFSLIDKIEEALNSIWRVRESRPLIRKFTDYLSVILVGPVLIFTAFALTASAQSHWLVQTVLQIEPLGAAVVFVSHLTPFLFICGLFTFLYKCMPHTQVRLVPALVGGVTAGILWHLAGVVFATFVSGSVRYSAVYSSFAILILFIIWLYVGWLIVLLGAQVAYYHQHPMAYLTQFRWKHKTPAFRERLALALLVQITKRYLSGERPFDPSELASTLHVPLSIVEDLLDLFLEQGLIYRTAEPKGITLGRPPEHVTVLEILGLVHYQEFPVPSHPSEPSDMVSTLLLRRDQAVEAALHGITLRALAAGEGEPFFSSEPLWLGHSVS
ncbi:MAG: YihY family inner membrane protein [Nitrospirae bacterium]|nr:MAG: YihY family inner membrane protein [Nitrospirota bacterium]